MEPPIKDTPNKEHNSLSIKKTSLSQKFHICIILESPKKGLPLYKSKMPGPNILMYYCISANGVKINILSYYVCVRCCTESS